MSIYNYKVGGSLEYQHPTYVVRQADRELYDGLTSLEFCYVLNSRQMGKSSLRVQMMNRLQAEGINCVSIDLTLIGSDALTPENWYGGIAFELLSGFNLLGEINFNTWWRDRLVLPPVQRLSLLIEEILLTHLSNNIVIFIDEIDSVKSLNFPTDDFFALIRGCYNRRVDRSDYKRITFCLLGVATPSDLIEDKGRTPFNIGQAIELTGFTFEEAKLSLTPGLHEKIDNPELIIKAVLDWTGGQPFLTQKLCHIIYNKSANQSQKSKNQTLRSLSLKQPTTDNQQPTIDTLVQTHIIDNWENQDEPEHLKTLRNRLLSNEQNSGRLLGLYQEILHNGEIIADDSPEQAEFRLTGLVCKQQGKLKVYNRIYQEVFNLYWVEKELSSLRPYTEAIAAWFASNRQDESRLLRGRALQEALDWKAGKSLSVEDDDFLAASQQKELDTEREANKILADAKGKAEQLLEKAKVAKQQAEELLAQTKKITQIERNDVKA
ncbi:AAA-like domain-containing protein, partial [Limnofasciculus baicalensis]